MYSNKVMVSREQGAVSIFIVVFFSLLIGVITMSFIGIVLRDANQSTNNDLSRSAYDSAQAGVEDAKRAIASYATACNNGDTATCSTAKGYFSDQNCTAFTGFARDNGVSIPSGTNDVPVSTGDATTGLNQAYTCVQVLMNTPDYVNNENPYQSDIVPLKAVNQGGTSIHPASVTLSWFNHNDAGPSVADDAPYTPRPGGSLDLTREDGWNTGNATPSLMRVQLISYGGGQITDASLQTSSKTLFLYPSQTGTRTVSFDDDTTPPQAGAPAPLKAVNCSGNGPYACNIQLNLGAAVNNTSFLRVTPIYKKSTFRVQFADPVNQLFDGIQPSVDSTGRANDLFRRVEARVRLQNSVLYPEYAIDSNASLCKDFQVGSQLADYYNRCP